MKLSTLKKHLDSLTTEELKQQVLVKDDEGNVIKITKFSNWPHSILLLGKKG